MTWEALTAIATAFTGLVIGATVIVGARQLRLTRDTLDHLRRATQLEGAMKILDDITQPEFREAVRFVGNELPEKMNEPAFREELKTVGLADSNRHKELIVLRTFERVGVFVKLGLLDSGIIYDFAIPVIVATWQNLEEVVAIHRQAGG